MATAKPPKLDMRLIPEDQSGSRGSGYDSPAEAPLTPLATDEESLKNKQVG